MVQAVFLDRDGVLNQERSDYVKSWAEFAWLPGVLLAVPRLVTLDCLILVVSNQSAIGRRLVSLQTVHEIHTRLSQRVAQSGGRIDDFYVCPHHPDDQCDCRKPKPGLLTRAAADYQLDLAQCVFVGDSITDYQAAKAAGCHCVLVQSGLQGDRLRRKAECNPDLFLVPDLASAVSSIQLSASMSRATPPSRKGD